MASHPLTDLFYVLGDCNMQTADQFTEISAVMPEAVELIEAYVFLAGNAADAELSVDIVKNGVDTTFDIIVPNLTPAATPLRLVPTGKVYLQPGDLLRFRSDGDNTASANLAITAVVRRAT